MLLLLTVILVALISEYINSFHDTANPIATVVSTKVLTHRFRGSDQPRQRTLGGHVVAKTISSGLVEGKVGATTPEIIIASALLGGIIWNLITWWFGLPSRSSRALVGGLCGAVLGASGSLGSIIWAKTKEGAPRFKKRRHPLQSRSSYGQLPTRRFVDRPNCHERAVPRGASVAAFDSQQFLRKIAAHQRGLRGL